jgi:hypothetical protein
MNKTVLFLVILIANAFVLGAKSTTFDKIMTKLVQMHQDIGSDESEIVLKVQQVKESISAAGERVGQFFSEAEAGCNGGDNLMQEYIQHLQEDQQKLQGGKNHYDSFAVTHGESAHADSQELEQYKGELEKAHEELQELIADLRRYGIEAEEKLVLIKYLKDIITDELLKAPEQASFIQLKTFNDKMRQLKVLLEKTHDSQYAPLVTTLLTILETRGFSDQGILQNILDVLGKLEQNLRDFRDKQEHNGQEAIERKKEEIKNKLEQIKHKGHRIADARSEIQNAIRQSAKIEKELALLDVEIARKQSEEKYWSELCGYIHGLSEKTEQLGQRIEATIQQVTDKAFGH